MHSYRRPRRHRNRYRRQRRRRGRHRPWEPESWKLQERHRYSQKKHTTVRLTPHSRDRPSLTPGALSLTAASLDDAVESGTVHGAVTDNRECGGAPRFDHDGVAILELPFSLPCPASHTTQIFKVKLSPPLTRHFLLGVPHFVGRAIFWGQSAALALAAHLPEPSPGGSRPQGVSIPNANATFLILN